MVSKTFPWEQATYNMHLQFLWMNPDGTLHRKTNYNTGRLCLERCHKYEAPIPISLLAITSLVMN